MGRVNTTRHDIDFGESLAWTPADGTAEFYVWSKVGAEDAAMRWRRLAGWSITHNAAETIPDAPATPSLVLAAAALALSWADLLDLHDGFDAEVLQVTSHAADARC